MNIDFKNLNQVNYNNYLTSDNSIDYKGDLFVWQKGIFGKRKVVAQNTQGDMFFIKEANAPFQISDNQLFFLKNHELKCKKIDSNKTIDIAEKVEKFIVRSNDVVYLTTNKFDGEEWNNKLILYDFDSTKNKILHKNIQQFYIHHEKLYVVNNKRKLFEVPIDNGVPKIICTIPEEHYTNTIMPQGENLVYVHLNELILFNVKSKNIQTISLTEGVYANNRISYICDDENIFVSFQATKTNGSIVSNIEDTNNGLWFIDPYTLKKEKITSYVFDRLYLFEDMQLFGSQGNNLFQIDVASNQVIPIGNTGR